MRPVEVTNLCSTAKTPAITPATEVKASVSRTIAEEPKIVKVAKLGLVLADKSVDPLTKRCCVKAAYRVGTLTNEECTQLMMFIDELERFLEEISENIEDKEEN